MLGSGTNGQNPLLDRGRAEIRTIASQIVLISEEGISPTPDRSGGENAWERHPGHRLLFSTLFSAIVLAYANESNRFYKTVEKLRQKGGSF